MNTPAATLIRTINDMPFQLDDERSTAFSSISIEHLEFVRNRIRSAKSAGLPSIALVGAWVERRLCIVRVEQSTIAVDEVRSNPEALRLIVPTATDESELLAACARFGRFTEELWRQSDRRPGDLLVSESDGSRHIVPRFDHRARCGHASRRWLGDEHVSNIAHLIQPCSRCHYPLKFTGLTTQACHDAPQT